MCVYVNTYIHMLLIIAKNFFKTDENSKGPNERQPHIMTSSYNLRMPQPYKGNLLYMWISLLILIIGENKKTHNEI